MELLTGSMDAATNFEPKTAMRFFNYDVDYLYIGFRGAF
jgi:hypothetical protein